MTPKDWDKIEKLLGPMADQETVETVKSLVEGIETNLKGSLTANVVKSVQRGFVPYGKNTGYLTSSHVDDGTRTFYKDITISSVDTSKCQVILHVNGTINYSYTFVSSTKLRIYLGTGADNTSAIYNSGITYEIVEFY